MGSDILRHLALIAGFLLCFFVIGIPHWLLPYNEVSLPNTMIHAGLLILAGAALALRAGRVASTRKVALVLGAAAPVAVLARVGWDIAADPTSHNLWPFEVVLSLGLGLGVALAGALAGALVGALLARIGAPRADS